MPHGRIINFDNSATTFPKPAAVKDAAAAAITKYGGNPGRSGHKLSLAAAQQVFYVRERAAKMFGAETENVAFTSNCTFSLNMAIKGLMQFGGHIIISAYEHNAVARPVYALSQMRGVEYSIAPVFDDTDETVKSFESLIRHDTKCICCTIASNVTGRILPYKQLAQMCKKHGIAFICDGAQACGILDIKLSDGINFLCTAGHKALYGPTGTGLLISDGEYSLSTIVEGGTGATSSELAQTPFLPEKLESGTINTVGILGLGEGLKFVSSKTPEAIRRHESKLCKQFYESLKDSDGIKFYEADIDRVPVLAFNYKDTPSQQLAGYLSDKDFALRGGLQCAAVTHNTLGTTLQGVVRFSPSVFSTPAQVNALASAVKSFSN